MRRLACAALVLAAAWSAAEAAAQVAPAGVRALSMGQNGTALMRGAEGVVMNPATAALPERPRYSVAILPLTGGWGLRPLSLSELAEYEGRELPARVREDWLTRIEDDGGLSGSARAALTGLALQVGPVGFTVGGTGFGAASLAGPAAELLLFGNAGRTGEARDMELEGSALDAAALSTVGVSFAVPIRGLYGGRGRGVYGGQGALGISLTYTTAHAMVLARDLGSRLDADPLAVELRFPIVHNDPDASGSTVGRGLGVTLGAAWTRGPLSLGLVARNVVHTFGFRESALVFRPGEAFMDGTRSESDFDERPLAEAPDELRSIVASRGPSPRITVSGSWQASESLFLTGDLSRGMGTDLLPEPRTRAGVGAEVREVRRLPLRAGFSLVSGGVEVGGGLGLHLGPVELAAGILHGTGSPWGGTTLGTSVTISPR